MQPNLFATLALVSYPIVVFVFFSRYRAPVAVTLSLLVSEMFLPPAYLLPIWPWWLNKWTIPTLAAGLAAWTYGRSYLRSTRAFRGMESVFLLGILGNFMTYWTNRDPVQYGPVTVHPQTYKDFVSATMVLFIDPWLTFYLGRAMFRTSRDLTTLCRMLVVAMTIYTLFILFEIRMSPQLNRWIYGYQPSGFGMTIRWGGYRPVVFFDNGLPLASFSLLCTMMALASTRAGIRISKLPMKWLCLYLVVVFVLCKSTGAIVYALILLPLILLAAPRRALTVSTVLTLFFLAYPFLRINDVIPTKSLTEFFGGVSAERAGSLSYRFDMEGGMFELARQRMWFGWGIWDRNFVHDPVTGVKLSVPDGAVVITVSIYGIVGFVAYYFTYAWTLLRAPRLIKKIRSRSDRILLSALTVNCAVILFDLILNSAFTPLFMMLFGVLSGLPKRLLAEEAAQRAASQAADFELGGQHGGSHVYS